MLIGFKIWVLWINYEDDIKNPDMIVVDLLISIFLAIWNFGVIAGYIILYIKFVQLIRTSNGLLDFMICQTKAFFMFIFIVLTLRTFSTVANPIFFDIIEDKKGN